MDINNLNACIEHDEATILSYMRDPAFADFMLQDAINEGDIDEIRKIQRRINEAKSRSSSAAYWEGLLGHAQETARSGYNINTIIERVSKALNILQSALPASSIAQQG